LRIGNWHMGAIAMNDSSADTGPTGIECPTAKDPAVRRLILAAMLLGFGTWCFVDHFVKGKYPSREQHERNINERNLPPKPYNVSMYAGYLFNHYAPFVLIPAGLFVVGHVIPFLRRRLIADEEGVGYAGKEKIAWSDITRLDTSKWESRRILWLHYGQNKLKLDALDFRKKPFRDVVAMIERRVPSEARQQEQGREDQ